jgi:hypothetical protein
LPISVKEKYSAEDGTDEPNGYSIYDGISAVPQNYLPNHSSEEKNAQNSVPLDRKKPSNIFVPKHIKEKKNSSEFHSVEQM